MRASAASRADEDERREQRGKSRRRGSGSASARSARLGSLFGALLAEVSQVVRLGRRWRSRAACPKTAHLAQLAGLA